MLSTKKWWAFLLMLAWMGGGIATPLKAASSADLPQIASRYAMSSQRYQNAAQQLTQARAEVIRVRKDLLKQKADSPEVISLAETIQKSQQTYNAERARIEQNLTKNNQEYAKLVQQIQVLSQKIAAERKAKAPQKTIDALAIQKLRLANAASSMVNDVLLKDSAAQQARDQMVTSSRRLDRALDTDNPALMKNDQMKKALADLHAAQAAYTQEQTQYAGAQAAYNVAIQQARADQAYRQTHAPATPYDLWYYDVPGVLQTERH